MSRTEASRIPLAAGHEEQVFEAPPHWQVLDVANLSEWKSLPLRWLVKDIIAQGNLVFVAASTQTGKTLLALELASLLTRGGKLFGRYPVTGHGLPILYFALEDPPRRFKARLQDIARGHGPAGEPLEPHRFRVHFTPGFNLGDGQHLGYLEKAIGECDEPPIIILDTYQRATPGLSSFGDEQQSRILHNLADLTRTHQATLIVLDHLRKAPPGKKAKITIDDIKGTGGKAQNADAVILMVREKSSEGRLISFRSFSKDCDKLVQILLRVSAENSGQEKFAFAGEIKEQQGGSKGSRGAATLKKVLDAVTDVRRSCSEIAGSAKVSESHARRSLKGLCDKGLIKRTGQGPQTRYSRITSEAPGSDADESDQAKESRDDRKKGKV